MKRLILLLLILCLSSVMCKNKPTKVPQRIYAEWDNGVIRAYDPIFGLNKGERQKIINTIFEKNKNY
jgi:hypothetical protein